MSISAVSPLGDSDHGWSEIEQFISEIAKLSQSDIAFREYAEELLDRSVSVLTASGGAVWVCGSESQLHLQCERNLNLLGGQDQAPATANHARFLQKVIQSDEATVAPPRSDAPRSEASRSDSGMNDSNYLWIGAPFHVDGQVSGLIVVFQPPGIGPAAEQGNVKLLNMVGDLTSDFLRRQQVRDLRDADRRWHQYESLVDRIHSSLDLKDTTYQLVNDGRTFIGCDRVSVALARADRWRVTAISGVDTFERRSETIRALEQLVGAVMRSGEPLHFRGDSEQLAPQIEKPLGTYIDASHALTLDVVPLRVESSTTDERDRLIEGDVIGALIIEQFESSGGELSAERIDRLARVGSAAIRNAMDYDTLPFLSAARWTRRATRFGQLQGKKLALAAIAGSAVVIALILVPASFDVKVEGELQPQLKRDVYAPLDGEVVSVSAQHDDDVAEGDVLLTLRSRPLELQWQRLQGEYQTTEKKLLAIASARIQNDGGVTGGRYPGQLAAEEQELKQLLASQQEQLDLIRRQRDSLTVRSPIKGRVLTWDPDELLTDRPVQRGQLLMTTADIDGAWQVELLVPDRRAGYLLDAQRGSESPLAVTFSLATDRSTSFEGEIEQIAGRTEVFEGQRANVRVTATVPESAADLLRPGATIYAKIHCGTRSLGFVWLHDMVDTAKAWLWL